MLVSGKSEDWTREGRSKSRDLIYFKGSRNCFTYVEEMELIRVGSSNTGCKEQQVTLQP